MANVVKSVTNHSGGTKICTGCGVSAPSNAASECKNCTMVFVKIIKVKSLVDTRGTKCCPNPECRECAKSNRALKCKLCKTPFVIKGSYKSKRKASTTFVKKAKKQKMKMSNMDAAFQNDTLIVDDEAGSLFEPVSLSRGSSLQEGLFEAAFDFDDVTTFDFGQVDDLLGISPTSDAFIDEMTSAFTEEPSTVVQVTVV
tara:strand:- start:536 stop:1132 length:597 start_codon:yes stop_codon:yes gene_type:complete